MYKHLGIIIFACMLVLFPLVSSAQYVIKALPRWMISTHLDYMIPREPIDQFLDEDDWGYRFEFQYKCRQLHEIEGLRPSHSHFIVTFGEKPSMPYIQSVTSKKKLTTFSNLLKL